MGVIYLNQYLKRPIEYIPLGNWPTPIQHLKLSFKFDLYIKRDDLSSDEYGGNKIRKLELILPKIKDKDLLISFGGSGSHQLGALALYSKRYGYKLISIIKSQYPTYYQKKIYEIIKENSYRIIEIEDLDPFVIVRTLKEIVKNKTYILFPGGTTPLTVAGYIGAVIELVEQIKQNRLPYPEKIYIAVGSGGSCAGILAGVWLLNLPIKVIGVKIVNSFTATKRYIVELAKLSLKYLDYKYGLKKRYRFDLSSFYLEENFIGKGYGYPTKEAIDAINYFSKKLPDLTLEPTYTAKTLSALLSREKEVVVLYWHTAPRIYKKLY